ncbi:MAG: hypothetical protein ACRCR9_03670 [Chitinophagaceae bacterium]
MSYRNYLFFIAVYLYFSIPCTCQTSSTHEIEIQELDREIMSLKNDLNIRNKIIFGLKQDNAYLRKRINFLELATNKDHPEGKTISHFANNYNFKIVSCFGDRLYQTVTINFLICNRVGKNQLLTLDCGKTKSVAYDDTGSAYSIKYAIIGNKEKDDNKGDSLIVNMPYNAYIKGAVVFRAVLGGTQFKLLRLAFSTENEDSTKKITGLEEIRNLKIKWE